MLIYAIISITLALVFYSIGVWSEKIQGTLKTWHLIIFWMGLVFDTVGTSLMKVIADGDSILSFHGITGLLAIILMAVHAVWATKVVLANNEKERLNFHKFSIVVWLIWLIPFVSGAVFGMSS